MNPSHDSSVLERIETPVPIVPGQTQPADPKVHERRWWILAVLCLSLLIVGIDGTIVNVALPSFVRELGSTTASW